MNAPKDMAGHEMRGLVTKTAVVTGASSGVGREAAVELAGQGWNVIGLGRSPERCAEAFDAIKAAASANAHVHMIEGDLAVLSETSRMAREILALDLPIHVYCANAGGVRDAKIVTPEGNEATFSGNHLGHFLLLQGLLPVMLETAASCRRGDVRIIAVSSEGHRQAPPFDWNDLQLLNSWNSGASYCLAKLCNLLFIQEASKRFSAHGIVAHAMHPGEAATNFASHADAEMKAYMETLQMIPAEIGGRTLAWLASSDAAGRMPSGYFFDCQPVEPSVAALDARLSERLWRESERLVARAAR